MKYGMFNNVEIHKVIIKLVIICDSVFISKNGKCSATSFS